MGTYQPGAIQRKDPAGDVLMVLGPNGGDLVMENGQIQMTPGFKTAALLGLAGGNEDDPGTGDAGKSWWGNTGRPVLEQYRGTTGHLLATIPPTSNGIRRIQAAADRDLAFLSEAGAASKVRAEATMPAKDKIDISGTITARGREESFNFSFNWRAQADEFAAIEAPYFAGSLSAYWVDGSRDLFVDNFGRFFLMGG